MKALNIKGIIILVSVLLAVQLIVGLVLSPMVSPLVVKVINDNSNAKISVGGVHIWPLTLSCSLNDLKVFDPDNEKERIASIKKAGARISFLALLSKRIVISSITISGAEIDVRGEPDGSFNIQKLAPEDKAAAGEAKTGIFDKFKGKKDWFTRVFDMVKKNASKESVEKKQTEKKDKGEIKTDVVQLPKGRRVIFSTLSDPYIFQIRNLAVKNSSLKLYPADTGAALTVGKANIAIKNLGMDPLKGARFDKLSISGKLDKAGSPAGSFDLDYDQTFKGGEQRARCTLSAKNIDLAAIQFIYEDSLPISFSKGILDIRSDTGLVNENIDSKNNITLKDQEASAKGGGMVGMIPMPALCDALNQVNPASFSFTITGTVNSPKFGGLEDALMKLLKPYLENLVTKNLKEKAEGVLGSFLKKETGGAEGGQAGGDAASDALKSIKGIFGEKK